MRRMVPGVLAGMIAFLALQGCAHSALERSLDEKLAVEPAVESRKQVQAQTKQLLETAPGLSAEQKAQLVSLRDITRAQMDKNLQDSLKLRSILVKDLLSPNYDDAEVDLIKERMKELGDKRLTLLFEAVEKANRILGHETAENRWIDHQFVEMYGGHHL